MQTTKSPQAGERTHGKLVQTDYLFTISGEKVYSTGSGYTLLTSESKRQAKAYPWDDERNRSHQIRKAEKQTGAKCQFIGGEPTEHIIP